MALVRFASVCDLPRDGRLDGYQADAYRGELGGTCHKRSEEYTEWPTCRECFDHVCPDHQAPGSVRSDVDVFDCVCLRCAE